MYKNCVICWELFLLKTWNQVTCNKKECKLQRAKDLKYEKLKNPIYKENYILKKKKHSKEDYLKHKDRCIKNSKKLRYTLICKKCWKEFLWYSKKLIYCSDECENINLSINRLWINNPSYRNWFYTSNDRTLHNYKNRLFENNCKLLDNKMLNDKWYLYCENCWVSNSLRFEHHHIIYRSEKPKHEHLHDINNIILLCIKCHNEFHKCKWIRNDLVKKRKLNLLFWNDVLYK